MKVKAINRSEEGCTRERAQDVQKVHRNLDPALHPFEKAKEYTRALNAGGWAGAHGTSFTSVMHLSACMPSAPRQACPILESLCPCPCPCLPAPHLGPAPHPRPRSPAPHRAAKLDRVFAKPFLAALPHDDGITCLARNPRRLNSLLSGAADGDVRLWDIPARRCLRRMVGHTAAIKGISVTPDGEAAVSCSTDCTVKLWKVRGGRAAGHDLTGCLGWLRCNRRAVRLAGAMAAACVMPCRLPCRLPCLPCSLVRQPRVPPPPRRTARCLQVPFAPFDGGPLQEDSQPVLEFSGRHAFRSVDHHWGRAQFATAGAAVEVWDHERSEPVQTFSWGADTLTSGGCVWVWVWVCVGGV